jgi:uridine kinase
VSSAGRVEEALMLADIGRRLRQAPQRVGATRVLAVDGPSGSGKTVLADRLSGVLDGAPVVHMDDLYPGWDGLEDAVPRLVEWVLAPLARGEPARYRRYDWARGEYAEWCEVPAADVIVVEGVGSGAAACAPYLSLLVWVEADRDVRFARGIERDGETYRPHWLRWARMVHAQCPAAATRERAHVLHDTTTNVLRPTVFPK